MPQPAPSKTNRLSRQKTSRIALALLLVPVFIFASTAPANAVKSSTGMNSRTFCVQNPSVNNTWLTAINNGRNAWNNHASFPGSITAFTGCTNTLKVGRYGLGWFGLYTPLVIGSQYEIKLDSTNLNSHINSNGYTFANVVKSTTAHEFGHALRLADHSDQPTKLMSSNRNRNVVTGPTTAEVNESNGYY